MKNEGSKRKMMDRMSEAKNDGFEPDHLISFDNLGLCKLIAV